MFDELNQASNSVQKLLMNKDIILEDLLRDENLLDEFISQNNQLIKYFDNEKIKKLIDYIIKEPEINNEDIESKENKDKGYRFPFICSQIFGLEINELFKYFFMTNKQIEEQLKKEKEKENKEKEKEKIIKDLPNLEGKNKSEDNNGKKENEYGGDNDKNDDIKNKENIINQNKIEEEHKDKEINNNQKNNLIDKKNSEKENGQKIKDNKGKSIEEQKEEKDKNKENLISKKEKDKKINKDGKSSYENRIELIDYLFTFLPKEYEEDKPLNYVLCGYFSSIITNLLDINPIVFLNYVYNERKDVFFLLTSHCYRKSICDTLSKLLHFENYFIEKSIKLDEETIYKMNEIRIEVLRDIFTKINIDMNNEQLNSIYTFITELFDSSRINQIKDLFKKIVDNKIIIRSLIYQNLFNLDLISNFDENVRNKRKNFIIIVDIIIFLLKNIKLLKLQIPTCFSPDSILTLKNTRISEEIFDTLPNLIKNNFNKKNNEEKKMLQSFNEYQLSPLGEYKIKIVDLIYHLIPYFKKISNFFDAILIKAEFFKYGFQYLFEYEWNNLYQESFLSLLKAILDNSDNHELLIDYLFKKLKIFNIIKSHINKDKFKFLNKDISTDISHGYISFLISLCYKINTVIGGTPLEVNTNPSTEGSFEFIPKCNEENNQLNTMNLLHNEDNENEKKENKEDDEKKGVPIESMKKYLDENWKSFFNENISETIKQYCDKNWPKLEKELDIFDFFFQDNNYKEENNLKDKEYQFIDIKNILNKNENEEINQTTNKNEKIENEKDNNEISNNHESNKDENKEIIDKKEKEELKGNEENENKINNNKEENNNENQDFLKVVKEKIDEVKKEIEREKETK